MKYSIFFLLSGKPKKYRDKLVKEIGPKYGESYVYDSKLPAHVTLKAPFLTNKLKELEDAVKKVAKENNKSKIEIDGFGNFRRFVAFLKIKLSPEAKKTQMELIKELDKIQGIEINEMDRKWHAHSTISYGNKRETFNKIWNHLKKLDKPSFEIYFDNITIMKKERGKWGVHKKFKLK